MSSEELKPCPFCGCKLIVNNAGDAVHPWGADCLLAAKALVLTPKQVEGWNRRSADYAALEAENARLKREVSHWQGLAVTNRRVADDALAQLAAIQQAKGEVPPAVAWVNTLTGEATTHEVQVYDWDDEGEPVKSLMYIDDYQRITAAMAAGVERLRHAAAGELVERLAAQLIESGAENYQESHFELEFDASGEKCLAVVTLQRPDKPSPHELRAKAEQERDALRAELEVRTAQRDAAQDSCAGLQAMVNDLADELAEVKGQEPVYMMRRLDQEAWYVTTFQTYNHVMSGKSPQHEATKLYALPPASPDVEGLVKALEEVERRNDNPARFDAEIDRIVTTALSTWRQSHPKT